MLWPRRTVRRFARLTQTVGDLAYAAAMTTSELTAVPAEQGKPATPAAPRPDDHAAPRPWALSPSRAGDFMTCPLLYRFRVIDRLPEPASPATTRGTLVHGVLERLFDSPAPERTLDRAAALVEPEWQRLLEERPELAELFDEAEAANGAPHAPTASADDQVANWLASARRLLETYFALEDPTRVEPAQRELLVEVALYDGVRLRGFVDRVDVAASGKTRIVDYKTGNAPSELFEAKALFQLKFYALVMWRLSGTVPTLLQLMYLGDGQVLRYAPDEADLLATERKVRALWAAIERALANREFPARPSRLCDWCAHQALCPAFGGVPPAYPEAAASAMVVPIDEPRPADDVTP
jgi:putative RecB family exonuclease